MVVSWCVRLNNGPLAYAAAFAFLTAGCGDGVGAIGGAGGPDRDRPFDNPPKRYVVEPDLRIGGTTDRPEEIVTRVSGLKINGNGTIFMMQPDDRTIRVFDSGGRFLRIMGRRGQGPGEFTGFGFFGFNHDSLWVTDPTQNRVSLFGPDGIIIRYLKASVNPPGPPYQPAPPLTYMEDGSILVRFVGAQEEISSNAVRPPDLLMRATSEGELLDTIRIFPIPAVTSYMMGAREMVARRPINNYPYVVFAPDGSQAVIVERDPPANPDSATFTVIRVGANGKIISEVRYGYTPRRVPQSIIDSLLPLAPDSAPAPRREMSKAQRENAHLPPYLPPINLTTVGRDGTIWISSVWAANRYRWTIIDASNEILGYADLPPGFRLLQADMEHVWGTELDDMDVPYVVRYRVKPAEDQAR